MSKVRSVSNTYCCVFGCYSSRRVVNPNLSFHKFPKKNQYSVYVVTKLGLREKIDKHKAWINNLKLKKPDSRAAVVCSLHFKRDDFILPDCPTQKPRLKRIAVPSLNLANETTGSKRLTRKRRPAQNPRSDNLKDSDREPWSMKIPKIEDTSDIDIKEEISLLEVCSSDIQTDSYSQPCSKKIPKLEDTSDIDVKEEILLEVSSTEEESASATERLDCLSPFSYSFRELDSSTESIQAPVILSSDTPQVINLKNDFGGLQNENYRLRRLLKECKSKLQETNEEFLEGVTLEDYMNLTFKFCRGNIELAHFINVQVSDLASEDE